MTGYEGCCKNEKRYPHHEAPGLKQTAGALLAGAPAVQAVCVDNPRRICYNTAYSDEEAQYPSCPPRREPPAW